MIKLFFLLIFLVAGTCSLRADGAPGGDQDFMKDLDGAKNPFEDGFPKPVVVAPKPVFHPEAPKPKPVLRPKIVPPPVKLPALEVQGIVLGEGLQQVIINDHVVPLWGAIEGARVIAVTKEGVSLFFKGKKFFLRVD